MMWMMVTAKGPSKTGRMIAIIMEAEPNPVPMSSLTEQGTFEDLLRICSVRTLNMKDTNQMLPMMHLSRIDGPSLAYCS